MKVVNSFIIIVIFVFCFSVGFYANDNKKKKDKVNEQNKKEVSLGSNFERVVSVYKIPDEIVNKKGELFKDILKIKNSEVEIKFDKIIYYKKNKMFLFLKNELVAITGLNNEKKINNVSLKKGVEYFIFKNGNDFLKIKKQKNNVIYFYTKKKIALVDDKNNDSIDLYILYK